MIHPLARILLALAAAFDPLTALAQPVQQRLTAADVGADDRFGVSVSISGDVALVGANRFFPTYRGSAYVFRFDGASWIEEQKLTAADTSASDVFGSAVSVSGDVAVVGAYGDDDSRGSAYVFRYDGSAWVQEQKLTASDGSASDVFGSAVSVSGDVAVVGAETDDDNGLWSGSAYVFRFDGTSWVQEQKLTAADGSGNDFFGSAVSVSGDVAVVGAYGDDWSRGSAYVFRYDGSAWVQEQKLTASAGNFGIEFGHSVSVSGDVVAVGDTGSDGNGSRTGAAYVFRYDGSAWVQEQKLMAADGSFGDAFGWSVSVSDDVAVVGAMWDDDNGPSSGSAYAFRHDGSAWVGEQKLTASDGSADDHFGWSVSASGATAVVGAYRSDDNGEDSGSAYAYGLSTLVTTEPEETPTSLIVHPPVPNPTAERAAVAFALAEAAEVRLALHDVLGREVAVVDAGRLAAGPHRLSLGVSVLPAGVYLWRLVAGERVETGPITVVR